MNNILDLIQKNGELERENKRLREAMKYSAEMYSIGESRKGFECICKALEIDESKFLEE